MALSGRSFCALSTPSLSTYAMYSASLVPCVQIHIHIHIHVYVYVEVCVWCDVVWDVTRQQERRESRLGLIEVFVRGCDCVLRV